MTTETPQTTPALTVAALVVQYLESQIDYKIDLSNNVYSWNVTLLVKYLNESDPTLLYNPQSINIMQQYLPNVFMEQLPQNILIYHCLTEYITNFNSTQYPQCDNSTQQTFSPMTNQSIDLCGGPFLHTDITSSIQEYSFDGTKIASECGLTCTAGSTIYGLTPSEQTMVDTFKISGCTINIIVTVFIAINQYLDQRKGGESLSQKSLLRHIPYVITLNALIINFAMLIGEIVGKENILCFYPNYKNYDEGMQFSLANPLYGKDAVCTIDGMIVYGSGLLWALYTALLSFALFRNFWNPLRPMWGIKKKWWHLSVIFIVFIFLIASVIDSHYGGMYPMGICTITSNIEGLVIFPLLLCTVISATFLTLCGVLLKRELDQQKKLTTIDKTTDSMNNLFKRLIVYGIGIFVILILMDITVIYFNHIEDELRADYQQAIVCQLFHYFANGGEGGDKDIENNNNCIRKVNAHPFWFMIWIGVRTLGASAHLILMCNNNAKNRIKCAIKKPVIMMSNLQQRKNDVNIEPNDSVMHSQSNTTQPKSKDMTKDEKMIASIITKT